MKEFILNILVIRMSKEECLWKETYESCVNTACGHVFNNYPSSGILKADKNYAGDQAFEFCPYCGRKIKIERKKK